GTPCAGPKRDADNGISSRAGEAGRGRAGERHEGSGGLHGPRLVGINRDPTVRRRRRAGDRNHALPSTDRRPGRSGARNVFAIMSKPLEIRWLGRIDYSSAYALQEELVAERQAHPELPGVLLLLEHEPVYTIGRTQDQSSLRDAERLPHPVVQINRGGQA